MNAFSTVKIHISDALDELLYSLNFNVNDRRNL